MPWPRRGARPVAAQLGVGRVGLGAELCAIEEQIVDPRLRDDLAEWRSCHRKAASYWEDAYDDEPPGEEEGDDVEEAAGPGR